MNGFGGFDNSMSVVDLLEARHLRLWEVVIERIAVFKLGVNNGWQW